MSKKTRLDVLLVEQGLLDSRQKAQAHIMAGLVFVNGQRVVCLERTNARYLDHEQVPDVLDFASIDVSFISLKLIFPALYSLLREGGEIACLIKPQFEAGPEKVGKKGVVRDPKVHLEVLENFLTHAKDNHFTVLGITYSPIRGPEGNIEYLGYLRKSGEPDTIPDLAALVDASHSELKERRDSE